MAVRAQLCMFTTLQRAIHLEGWTLLHVYLDLTFQKLLAIAISSVGGWVSKLGSALNEMLRSHAKEEGVLNIGIDVIISTMHK